jgi:hypothetical protein
MGPSKRRLWAGNVESRMNPPTIYFVSAQLSLGVELKFSDLLWWLIGP